MNSTLHAPGGLKDRRTMAERKLEGITSELETIRHALTKYHFLTIKVVEASNSLDLDEIAKSANLLRAHALDCIQLFQE